MIERENRGRLGLERGQVLQIVVDRLQRSVGRVLQKEIHPALEFAGEHAHPHVEGLLEIGLQLREHGEAAGDMEAADDHGHALRAEWAGDIEGAGILVRLHAHDPNQAEPVMALKLRQQLPDFDARVDLVDHRDVDGGVGSEHAALPRIPTQAVKHGERVRRHEGAHPLNDVAVVVVMRRLDQHELKASLRCTSHSGSRPLPTQPAGVTVVDRNCNTPAWPGKSSEST